MLLASHLRRSRHGIFYFRIVLPDPIAAVLGQRELVRSLGIRSPKLARQSGYQLSLRLIPILERLQRIMADGADPKLTSGQDWIGSNSQPSKPSNTHAASEIAIAPSNR